MQYASPLPQYSLLVTKNISGEIEMELLISQSAGFAVCIATDWSVCGKEFASEAHATQMCLHRAVPWQNRSQSCALAKHHIFNIL